MDPTSRARHAIEDLDPNSEADLHAAITAIEAVFAVRLAIVDPGTDPAGSDGSR